MMLKFEMIRSVTLCHFDFPALIFHIRIHAYWKCNYLLFSLDSFLHTEKKMILPSSQQISSIGLNTIINLFVYFFILEFMNGLIYPCVISHEAVIWNVTRKLYVWTCYKNSIYSEYPLILLATFRKNRNFFSDMFFFLPVAKCSIYVFNPHQSSCTFFLHIFLYGYFGIFHRLNRHCLVFIISNCYRISNTFRK